MLLGTDISAVLTTLEALQVDALGLNCSTGPEDMRDAIRFLGEYSPVPVHCIPNAGLPLQGPDGETIFPEEPEPLAEVLGEFVERFGVTIVGGCCGTTTEHIAAIVERCARHTVGPRPAPRPPHGQLDDRRRPARAGPTPHARRRARQLAGLAQGQGAAAGRRLRRPRAGRRGPGRGRRARARRLRRAHRAPGRGRADAPGRQARLASPSPRRSRSTRPSPTSSAWPSSRSRGARSSTRSTSRPGATSSTPSSRSPSSTAPRVIALTIDEVGMAKTAAAQGRDRPAHQGAGLRRARPRPRAADLRPAHLHADHRRRGVAPVGGRDDRGHPPAQAGAAAGQDLAGRLQRVLRRLPDGARGAQLGLPAPLRGGGARPRDGQPQPHHALRRDHRGRARAGRRPRLQPPRGRARAVHRPLRVQGRGGRRRGRRPDRRHGARGGAALAHPAAQEGRRRRTGSTARSRRSAPSRPSTRCCCRP